jgi:uncharacterized protein (TIGR02266 family)
VTCESGAGARLVGRAVDLGKGGLFVQTNDPMPPGKQVSVELQIPGQLATWSAIGRVRWSRAHADAGGKPAGMGVAFVDIDNAVLVAIGKILERGPLVERTDTATAGTHAAAAPARERTVLGVGIPTAAPVAPSPIVAAVAAPSRERTVLGVAPQATLETNPPKSEPHPGETTKVHPVVRLPPEASRGDEPRPEPDMPVARAPDATAARPPEGRPVPPERESSTSNLDEKWPDEPPESSEPPAPALPIAAAEPLRAAAIEPEKPAAPPVERSLAVDLVAEKNRAVSQPPPREHPSIDSIAPAGVPRGRGGRTVVLLLVAAAGVAAYAQRDRLRPFVAPYIAKAMAVTSPPGAAGATGGTGGGSNPTTPPTGTAITTATATATTTATPTAPGTATAMATATPGKAAASASAASASAPAPASPSASALSAAARRAPPAAAAPPPPPPKPHPAPAAAKAAGEAALPEAPDNPY